MATMRLVPTFVFLALPLIAAQFRTTEAQRSREHNYKLLMTFRESPNTTEDTRIFTKVLHDAMTGGRTEGLALANEMMNVFSSSQYSPEELKNYISVLLSDPPTRDIAAMCYAVSVRDITSRCREADQFAGTVYVQLQDTARRPLDSVKFEKWDPWQGASPKDREWFSAMGELSRSTKMRVIGMYLGKQNDEALNDIVKEYSSKFDGFLFVSEYGKGVCWTQLAKPKKFLRYGMIWNWLEGMRVKPRYLLSVQDPAACGAGNANDDIYVNSSERLYQIQDWILPIFPCYDGREWRCFEAFKKYPERSCNSSKQRYAFSPFRYSSAAVLRYFIDKCRSVAGRTPGFDLVEAL